MKQVVKLLTRNSVILDFIMSDMRKFYQEPLVLASIGSLDHRTIAWSSKVQLQSQKVSKRINVRPLNPSSLLAFEAIDNWCAVLNSINVNDQVIFFGKSI